MLQSSQQTRARQLYMDDTHTQRDIARELNVSERTIYTWIKTKGWDRLRQAARTAPIVASDNLYSQLVELQNTIAAREEGNRFPTMHEAEVTRKLVTCIEKMKKTPSLAQNMQMLQSFRAFAHDKDDLSFCYKLNNRIERFLEGEAENGYYPYQPEYGPSAKPEPLFPPEKTEVPLSDNETENNLSETLNNTSAVSPKHSLDLTPPLSTAIASATEVGESLSHPSSGSRGEAIHGHLSTSNIRKDFLSEILPNKPHQILTSRTLHSTSDTTKLSEEVGSISEVNRSVPIPKQDADTAFLRKNFPTRLSALRGENAPPD